MYILNQIFQPYTIVTEAAKALTEALQHIKMDEVFKDNYMIFAFERLPLIEPVCERQVHDLPQLWNKVDNLIDRDEFFLSFSSHCKQLDLPFTQYDLDSAFEKAQTEWAGEIMVATADFLLKWNEDLDILTQVACWINGHIHVDTNVCTLYRDWLMNNHLSELMNNMTC